MTSAAIMPRGLVLLLGACSFDATYAGGKYTCSDGMCPSGYTCNAAHLCEIPGMPDARMPDAPPAALTCADPGPFPATGGMTAGTTAGRSNTVSAMCGGLVMNGPDAIYRIDLPAAKQLTISITASYAANAYVLAPCTLAPATPTCETDMSAAPAAPLVVNATAGVHFIIVDNPNPALSGTYTLTVQ